MAIGLPEVLRAAINRALTEIHTCLPAKVESYDYKEQRCSVQPMLKKKYLDGITQELPVIVDVPVVFPRTNLGGFSFPINAGDYVMLMFCERSMERFLSMGGLQEPGDSRKFDLTDAIAIPGLYPFSDVSFATNNDDSLWLFKDNKIALTGAGDYILEVAKDTNLTIKGKHNVSIDGDSAITIKGNQNITISGTCDIAITGKANVDIQEEAIINVDDNITVHCDNSFTINTAADLNVNASGKVDISAADVDISAADVNITGNLSVSGTAALAGGASGIARIGDSVSVTIASGSSAGVHTGTITSGSSVSTSG